MLVCICHGISDKKIMELIQNGSKTLEDIYSKFGAGKKMLIVSDEAKIFLRNPHNIMLKDAQRWNHDEMNIKNEIHTYVKNTLLHELKPLKNLLKTLKMNPLIQN